MVHDRFTRLSPMIMSAVAAMVSRFVSYTNEILSMPSTLSCRAPQEGDEPGASADADAVDGASVSLSSSDSLLLLLPLPPPLLLLLFHAGIAKTCDTES